MRKTSGSAARRLINDTSGVTAIEYGLIAGLISLIILTALGTVGTKLTSTLINVGNTLN